MSDYPSQTIIKLEKRIHQLEEHQAYQDETVEQLNHLVASQQQDIGDLKHRLKLLSDFLRNMKSEMGSQIKLPSEEAPPPHY